MARFTPATQGVFLESVRELSLGRVQVEAFAPSPLMAMASVIELGQRDRGGGDVVAPHPEIGCLSAQIAGLIGRRDRGRFAWPERDVVVSVDHRQDLVADVPRLALRS